MARTVRVRHVAKVAKVKTTGYGRSTYRMRKPKSMGRYKEPELTAYGRGLYQEDYGCPDVKSTAVESIGFNDSLGRMTVTFNGGRSYAYYGVSRQKYQAFCAAQSKGRYVNTAVKGQYAYQRL